MTGASTASETMLNDVLNIVSGILGPDGLAVQNGYRFNAQQLDYASRAATGFCSYDANNQQTAINALEAATGLGKTLAYLAAGAAYSAVTGDRVAISTHSRQLQRQIFDKEGPNVIGWVETLTGVRLTTARRVGKSNYLDNGQVRALYEVLSSQGEHPAIVRFLKQLINWISSGESTGILDDFLQEHEADLPAGLAPRQICLGSHSDKSDTARYDADIAVSKNVDLLIVNHALLALHAFRWGKILDDEDGRTTRVVIVDEAHRLPAVAESILSDALPLKRFARVSESVSDHVDGKAKTLWRSLTKHLDKLSDFLVEAKPDGADRFVVAHNIENLPEQVNEALPILVSASQALVKLTHQLSTPSAARDDMLAALDFCLDYQRISDGLTGTNENIALVSWSPIRAYPSLSVGMTDASRMMSRLWAKVETNDDHHGVPLPPRPNLSALLLTSATLGPPGNTVLNTVDPLLNDLGIIRHASKSTGLPVHYVLTSLMAQFEPTSFGVMRFVLADPRTPVPIVKLSREAINEDSDSPVVLNKAWLAYAAKMIQAAHRERGRVLVLANSWRETDAINALLTEQAPKVPLIRHRRGQPLRNVLSDYVETTGAVLITPSAWDGVDLPGLVPALVILRLPFPPINRANTMRLRVALRSVGFSDDKIQTITFGKDQRATWEKLRQGFGRGIRSPYDDCTVWIADPRFPVPEHWFGSFDPLLERMPPGFRQRQHRGLLNAIPKRFLPQHAKASVFSADSLTVYQPEEW